MRGTSNRQKDVAGMLRRRQKQQLLMRRPQRNLPPPPPAKRNESFSNKPGKNDGK
ncbi:MAG: hypothetical protein ONB44_18155 [candidate division KSB1 bacterium]|nr:hypothetical protein [candidate division KSB1 bacterium]MDZ7304052.1 hypothetical protein [candidate division KSB1 bacterium]